MAFSCINQELYAASPTSIIRVIGHQSWRPLIGVFSFSPDPERTRHPRKTRPAPPEHARPCWVCAHATSPSALSSPSKKTPTTGDPSRPSWAMPGRHGALAGSTSNKLDDPLSAGHPVQSMRQSINFIQRRSRFVIAGVQSRIGCIISFPATPSLPSTARGDVVMVSGRETSSRANARVSIPSRISNRERKKIKDEKKCYFD